MIYNERSKDTALSGAVRLLAEENDGEILSITGTEADGLTVSMRTFTFEATDALLQLLSELLAVSERVQFLPVKGEDGEYEYADVVFHFKPVSQIVTMLRYGGDEGE